MAWFCNFQINIHSCHTYSDVKSICPHYIPLADRMYDSFLTYIELRDDRLNSVCFDRVEVEVESSPKKRNAKLIKAFAEICETLISIKAFCEEGVFRKPGMKVLVTKYTTRIQNVMIEGM